MVHLTTVKSTGFFPTDYRACTKQAEKGNFRIGILLNEASIDFAFPAQIYHLKL